MAVGAAYIHTTKHNTYLLISKSITIIFKANQIEMRIIFFSISFANIKLVHKQLTIALERNAKFIEGKHIINAKQMGEFIEWKKK